MNFKKNLKNNKNGYVVLLVLVFSSVFILLMTALTGFVFTQNKVSVSREYHTESEQIAEAGLDYYKWFLAHYPTDITDGTGLPGPYVHEYSDPEKGPIGKFSLEINGNLKCGGITAIDITSTGWTYKDPSKKRVVFARYTRPSVAEYSYIINSSVRAGADRNIKGKYHSNGGIRMDGTNTSLVTSAQKTWLCTSSFGCSTPTIEPGVFGDGSGSSLWKFPVEQIDFTGLTVSLLKIKDQAQNNGGLYFPQISGGSPRRGYEAIFKSDGTFDLYSVNDASYAYSLHIDDVSGGWKRDYYTITSRSFLGNYTIPSSCSVIFFEDKLWIEGTIKGKVTVVAADVTHPNTDPNVILNNSINYTTDDGSDGLTLISEKSILIPLHAPDDMVLKGIYIAQKGYFGRNLYACWYYPYDKRNSLTMKGSVVSNGRVGTKWGYSLWSCGFNQWSGFNTRENSYDRKLASDPPPMTPFTDDEYKFIEWRDLK